jgi:hypothetical protein
MVAILFNPLTDIHMTKEVWMFADALAGALFSYTAWLCYKTDSILKK